MDIRLGEWVLSVLGLLALLVPFLIVTIQRSSSRINYVLIRREMIVKSDQELSKQLSISFLGKPVDQVYFQNIAIANTGNTPIKPQEYFEPITIEFPEDCEILSANIGSTYPENLNVKLKLENNKIIVDQILFNDGEVFGVNILTNKESKPIVNARIVGLKGINEAPPNIWIFFFILIMFVFSLFLSFLILNQAWNSNKTMKEFFSTFGLSTLQIVLYALYVIAIILGACYYIARDIRTSTKRKLLGIIGWKALYEYGPFT